MTLLGSETGIRLDYRRNGSGEPARPEWPSCQGGNGCARGKNPALTTLRVVQRTLRLG